MHQKYGPGCFFVSFANDAAAQSMKPTIVSGERSWMRVFEYITPQDLRKPRFRKQGLSEVYDSFKGRLAERSTRGFEPRQCAEMALLRKTGPNSGKVKFSGPVYGDVVMEEVLAMAACCSASDTGRPSRFSSLRRRRST